MDEIKNIICQEGAIRLDVYLTRELKEFSRSFIQKLIKDKKILLNGDYPSSHTKLKIGDKIEIFIPSAQELQIKPEKIPLKILYEDKDIIVIDKPAGMVVHPAPGNYEGTLVNALLSHCNDLAGIGGSLRPGIVHRLDKETSGVIVVAKTDKAHIDLSGQFLNHKIEKKYIALVFGKCKTKLGRINVPVGRSQGNRKKMVVTNHQGRGSITFFKVLEEFRDFSLLEVVPKTGRTHQIRVHMAYIGHPVLGDKEYAPSLKKYSLKVDRQMLHAQSLKFIHPVTKETIEFTAPLPDDMKSILQNLRSENR